MNVYEAQEDEKWINGFTTDGAGRINVAPQINDECKRVNLYIQGFCYSLTAWEASLLIQLLEQAHDDIVDDKKRVLSIKYVKCICGHSWYPRKGTTPKSCPRCQDKNWNKGGINTFSIFDETK